MNLRKSYVATRLGQLHTVECGDGPPVLFLHQTPRSWHEYAEVLPIVGRGVRAIAMDTLGFGQSCKVDRPWSIELFADGVEALLDALALPTVSLVGHHTGAVVALEVADRVEEGHVRVNEYRMEDRLPFVRSRTLVLCGAEDHHSLPDVPTLADRLGCRGVVIEGAGVALPEQRPAAFAREVLAFVTAPDG